MTTEEDLTLEGLLSTPPFLRSLLFAIRAHPYFCIDAEKELFADYLEREP